MVQLMWIGKENLSFLDFFPISWKLSIVVGVTGGGTRGRRSGLLRMETAVTSDTSMHRRLCEDLLILDMTARDPHMP